MSSSDEEKKHDSSPSANKPLLMIPGPIEFDPSVYEALARKTVSHVAPSFINEFGEALDAFIQIIKANEECEPFILSGGGSLGWDCIVTGLCEAELKDRALILNGGYFSDNFRECAKAYGIEIDEIKASCIGDVVTPKQLEEYLSNQENPNQTHLHHSCMISRTEHTHTHTHTRPFVHRLIPQSQRARMWRDWRRFVINCHLRVSLRWMVYVPLLEKILDLVNGGLIFV